MESLARNKEAIPCGISLLRAPGLILVTDTPKGRGVFAGRDIPANTILDVAPVLPLDPKENSDHVKNTDLYNYTYNWPYEDKSPGGQTHSIKSPPKTTQAIVFGLGSLFNHSTRCQNVGWLRDIPNRLITYKTLREIKVGEELCISYGDRLTFVDADKEAGLLDDSSEDEEGGLGKIDLA